MRRKINPSFKYKFRVINEDGNCRKFKQDAPNAPNAKLKILCELDKPQNKHELVDREKHKNKTRKRRWIG